jgi:hypothetical protein
VKRPHFFIAGAPRSGTTALYKYLGEHPNIFLPEIKELHYFASDFPGIQKILFKSLDEYLKMFAGAGPQHLAVGEISPLYYYSQVALKKINNFDPSARIILILRNPVDFVESIHQLNLALLREYESDLEKAWELQGPRRLGKMIPNGCRQPELVLYGDLGHFGKHVERLFKIFPKEQVLVILFDDFSADPRASYEAILSFLGLASDGRVDFPPVNANYQANSRLLTQLIHPPQAIYRIFMKAISLFGVDFMKNISLMYNKVEMFNARRAPRPPMDPTLRAKLRSYFRDDIQKLAGLIDRDLSTWL